MNGIPFALHLCYRIARGEPYQKATAEEFRTDSAALSLAGVISLIVLSLDSDVGTPSPAALWTWVGLSLVPLAVFLLWVQEHVPSGWSLSVAVLIPAIVLAYAFLWPSEPVPVPVVARAGLALDVILMAAGSVVGRAW